MIKVAVWGTGMMGQGLLGYILDRPKDIELVGVIVTNPAKEGMTVGELLGRDCDVTMTTDFAAVLAKKPDVVCINTQSNLHEITDQVEPAVEAGCQRDLHRREARVPVGERPRVGATASTRSPRSTASASSAPASTPASCSTPSSSCGARSACASTASRRRASTTSRPSARPS